MRIELGTILSVFLDHHESCLGGDIDIVACPPSTQQPAGVQDIVGMFTRRFPGNVNPLSWDDPEQRTVKVSPTVADARVLLIDDTFTKGNRAVFPTAAALRRAGAEVLGPLVIGREFNPDYGNNDRIWRQLKGAEYDVTKCARCAGFRFDPPLRPGEQTQLFDH